MIICLLNIPKFKKRMWFKQNPIGLLFDALIICRYDELNRIERTVRVFIIYLSKNINNFNNLPHISYFLFNLPPDTVFISRAKYWPKNCHEYS